MFVRNVYQRFLSTILRSPLGNLIAASLHHQNQNAVWLWSLSTHVCAAQCPSSIHPHLTGKVSLRTRPMSIYATLAPPQPWCCPVSHWLKMNTQIIFSLSDLCFVSHYRTLGLILSQDNSCNFATFSVKLCYTMLCSKTWTRIKQQQ